jgi:hypothetical protein
MICLQRNRDMKTARDNFLLFSKWSLAVFIFSLLFGQSASAQKIIGITTKYTDSFKEWDIITDDPDIVGELRMRWIFQNDWSEWDLRVGDNVATIIRKWKDDPNLWEIRCNGVIVTAKTTWRDEFLRWKLSDSKQQINWKSLYANKLDEWSTDKPDKLPFKVYAYWDGDPREWVVEDNLPAEVSLAMKMAMIFLTVHFTAPHI